RRRRARQARARVLRRSSRPPPPGSPDARARTPPPPARSRARTGGSSVRAPLPEHRRDRLEQDRDVHPDRPVLEVVEVEPDESVERQLGAARDLPEAGDPRQDEVALAVPRLELLVVA